jgi:hypothetical protein
MVSGYVIAESMRTGSRLEGIPLSLKKIERYTVPSATSDQPGVWTVIEFEFAESEVERVISLLAEVLEEEGGWYSDINFEDEKIVIFAGKVFRYARGDQAARAKAQLYGREHGCPEPQLDWTE